MNNHDRPSINDVSHYNYLKYVYNKDCNDIRDNNYPNLENNVSNSCEKFDVQTVCTAKVPCNSIILETQSEHNTETQHSVTEKKLARSSGNKCVSRKQNKLNRNSNKLYVNYKGIEVEPRQFVDYECKCAKKCSIKLSTTQRRLEFEKFWALSAYDAQTAYIAAKVLEHPVKKRYGRNDKVKKDFSRVYSLSCTTICRDMFCKTLQISSGRINTALIKIRQKTSIEDQRGIRKSSQNIASNIENTFCAKNFVFNECSDNNNKSHDYVDTKHDGQENYQVVALEYAIHNETSDEHAKIPQHEKNRTNMCVVPSSLSQSCSNQSKHSKLARKLKYSHSRDENKLKRNSNKPHLNYKGILVEPKKFIDYKCKCNKQCQHIIHVNNRYAEFQKFWTLSYNSQTAYIVSTVNEYPVKKRYAADKETKKDYSRKYSLGSVTVCRDMFCRTLHVSPGRINTALKKYRAKSKLFDQRGIKQGGHNRLPIEKRSNVMRFFKKVPVYKSHLFKDKNKLRFLSPHLTLTKLYEIYKEEERDKAISNASFKKIFYSLFNIRPVETCNLCSIYKKSLKKELNEITRSKIKDSYNTHRISVGQIQKYIEHDILLAKKYSEIECITYGFQKVLPLPHISHSEVYMKRMLWLYNLSVYSAKKDQSYCYVWSESQGGKGAQEVSSCIIKHIKEEIIWNQEVTHIILWTDAHKGLNRNMKLILMLKCLLHGYSNLKSIKIKYLSSGHCNLPNQKDFNDIEKALKTNYSLFVPGDYVNLMKYCRKKKPLIVKLMNNHEFLSTEQLERFFINKFTDEKFQISNVSEITLCSNEPYNIYYCLEYYNEPSVISLAMRPGNEFINMMQMLTLLWPHGKQISSAKIKDLKSLLHLIPANARCFYLNLQSGLNNDEDVDGFNEDLDFSVE